MSRPPSFVRNMYGNVSVNADNAAEGRREANTADDGYALLAAEIVIHAVQDWRELVKGKRAGYGKNFTELRQFFQSAWCETLMQNFDIEPAELLAALEKELAEAKKKEQLEQSKKIKEAKA